MVAERACRVAAVSVQSPGDADEFSEEYGIVNRAAAATGSCRFLGVDPIEMSQSQFANDILHFAQPTESISVLLQTPRGSILTAQYFAIENTAEFKSEFYDGEMYSAPVSFFLGIADMTRYHLRSND